LKWLVVLDEYTHECLGLKVEHAMGAQEVVGIVEKLVAERRAPEFIRSDATNLLNSTRYRSLYGGTVVE
jgi:hypothetical protein